VSELPASFYEGVAFQTYRAAMHKIAEDFDPSDMKQMLMGGVRLSCLIEGGQEIVAEIKVVERGAKK
jgi:hypothetical protein